MNKFTKRTPKTGIIELNSLTELDYVPPPVLTSENLGWRDFRIERHCVSANVPLTEKFYTSHLIGIALVGQLKNNFSKLGGRRVMNYRKEDSVLCSAGLVHASYEPREMDLLLVYLTTSFVERTARDSVAGGRVELVPQLNLDDCFVGEIGKLLLGEAAAGGATGSLYAESLAVALAARLIKNYSAARLQPAHHTGGLAKRKLRLAVEFIEEHLNEDLSLSALAEQCDLSAFHFARAFKQPTGIPPHHFVNLRRIERGKELLRNSSLNVTEIAVLHGFTDHSHFAKVFRRFTGASPTAYRNEIRPE